MVLIRITKMLRGWLSMFKQECCWRAERQDGRIVKAPGTDPEWKEEMATAILSHLVPSESRSSTNARSDLAFAGVL